MQMYKYLEWNGYDKDYTDTYRKKYPCKPVLCDVDVSVVSVFTLWNKNNLFYVTRYQIYYTG